MNRASTQLPPLLIRWAPGRVLVFDPATRSTTTGARLDDCLNGGAVGREAIVAVAQRSAFVRSLQVPSLSRAETQQMLSIKLSPLMPLDPSEYVFGFRLGRDSGAGGRTAIVGAIKTASLRLIEVQCAAHGLKIRAVVPAAFGSWLAARERAFADGAVVEEDGSSLNVDVVSDGELKYSRSVPLPETQSGVQEEIARTFDIAELAPGPVLATTGPEDGEPFGSKSPLEHLADTHAVDRLLFSLELPEKTEARRSRTLRGVASRAIAAALVAVLLGGYAVKVRANSASQSQHSEDLAKKTLSNVRADQKTAVDENLSAQDERLLVNAAFRPAQSFSDVLSVLGDLTPSQVWLTGITIERGKPLIIEGSAMNGRLVAKFLKQFDGLTRFRHMRLVSTTRATVGQGQLEQFAMTGHIVGNLPIDAIPRDPSRK